MMITDITQLKEGITLPDLLKGSNISSYLNPEFH